MDKVNKAHLILRPLAQEQIIEVNGIDLAKMGILTGIKAELNVDIQRPILELSIAIRECDVTMEGQVKFNGNVVPKEMAKEVYHKLKELFDDENTSDH